MKNQMCHMFYKQMQYRRAIRLLRACIPELFGGFSTSLRDSSGASAMLGSGTRCIWHILCSTHTAAIIRHALSGVYKSTPPELSMYRNLDFRTPMHLSTTPLVFICALVYLSCASDAG